MLSMGLLRRRPVRRQAGSLLALVRIPSALLRHLPKVASYDACHAVLQAGHLMGDITGWIAQARAGDRAALDQIFEAVYPELRRIAHGRLVRHVRDPLLDTTALVHECYLKFSAVQRLGVADRVHFMAYAATAMRSVIVDWARSELAERRGGGAAHVTLDTSNAGAVRAAEDEIVDVDVALASLGQLDPRLARVVEMRYFCGMSDAEIGAALGVTDRTVRRDWEKARLLLAHALRG